MSTESRLVRPYTAASGLGQVLDGLQLRFGPETYSVRSSVQVDYSSYLRRPVAILLAADDEAFGLFESSMLEAAGAMALTADDLELVVRASSSFLKIDEVVTRCRLSKLAEVGRVLPLTADVRPRALQTPHGGCRIDVHLVLATERQQAPLVPWRKGTWLAHVRFSVTTDQGSIGIVPIPLTDELRSSLGLRPGCAQFIRLADESALDASVSDDAVEVYIDDEVLARLSADPTSPFAKVAQLRIFVDAVAEIARVAAAEVGSASLPAFPDLEGSLIDRAVRLVVGEPAGADANSLASLRSSALALAVQEPTRFVAAVEAACGLREAMRKALQ